MREIISFSRKTGGRIQFSHMHDRGKEDARTHTYGIACVRERGDLYSGNVNFCADGLG